MRFSSTLTLALLLIALPAAAQKITVDYDQATAFSEYRTFQFKETREDFQDTDLAAHKSVVAKLRGYLSAGGLEEVDSDPDVYIAYYAADRGQLRIVLGEMDYTYGREFGASSLAEGGVGNRTSDTFSFNQGTLVVDVWEADGKRLIWRAMGTAVIKKDPAKNLKKVDKALQKMMKQWDEMYGAQARAVRKMKEEQGG